MSAKPEVCNADINKDTFAEMVEESLLSANSTEAIFSKCEFKDSNFRTWKKRTPNVWPKKARGNGGRADCCRSANGAGKPVCDTLKIPLRSVLCAENRGADAVSDIITGIIHSFTL